MTPFVRFILFILAVGVTVNLTIVLLANTRSARTQAQAEAAERMQFQNMVEKANGKLRRADVVVEWQKIDASERVLQTSLLIRRFSLDPEGNSLPLPLTRVVVEAARLHVDGLLLEFDSLFSENNEDFSALRNKKLAYFAHVYGDEVETQRFSFVRAPQVPESMRLHPDDEAPGYFELRLWEHVWELTNDRERGERMGLKVTWMKPAERTVRIGRSYAAFLDSDGIQLVEDDSPELRSILDDAAKAVDAVIPHAQR